MSQLPASVRFLVNRGMTLPSREYLRPGECLRSSNRRVAALVTRDGRFCICLTASDGTSVLLVQDAKSDWTNNMGFTFGISYLFFR